jgi:hypothetical protein
MQAVLDDDSVQKIARIRQAGVDDLTTPSKLRQINDIYESRGERKNEVKIPLCVDFSDSKHHQNFHMSLEKYDEEHAGNDDLNLLDSALGKVHFLIKGVSPMFGKFCVLTVNSAYKMDDPTHNPLTHREKEVLDKYIPAEDAHISLFKWIAPDVLRALTKNDETNNYNFNQNKPKKSGQISKEQLIDKMIALAEPTHVANKAQQNKMLLQKEIKDFLKPMLLPHWHLKDVKEDPEAFIDPHTAVKIGPRRWLTVNLNNLDDASKKLATKLIELNQTLKAENSKNEIRAKYLFKQYIDYAMFEPVELELKRREKNKITPKTSGQTFKENSIEEMIDLVFKKDVLKKNGGARNEDNYKALHNNNEELQAKIKQFLETKLPLNNNAHLVIGLKDTRTPLDVTLGNLDEMSEQLATRLLEQKDTLVSQNPKDLKTAKKVFRDLISSPNMFGPVLKEATKTDRSLEDLINLVFKQYEEQDLNKNDKALLEDECKKFLKDKLPKAKKKRKAGVTIASDLDGTAMKPLVVTSNPLTLDAMSKELTQRMIDKRRELEIIEEKNKDKALLQDQMKNYLRETLSFEQDKLKTEAEKKKASIKIDPRLAISKDQLVITRDNLDDVSKELAKRMIDRRIALEMNTGYDDNPAGKQNTLRTFLNGDEMFGPLQFADLTTSVQLQTGTGLDPKDVDTIRKGIDAYLRKDKTQKTVKFTMHRLAGHAEDDE